MDPLGSNAKDFGVSKITKVIHEGDSWDDAKAAERNYCDGQPAQGEKRMPVKNSLYCSDEYEKDYDSEKVGREGGESDEDEKVESSDSDSELDYEDLIDGGASKRQRTSSPVGRAGPSSASNYNPNNIDENVSGK